MEKDLINLIPQTIGECEKLLQYGAKRITLKDRYGNTHTLNEKELHELKALTASQIGRTYNPEQAEKEEKPKTNDAQPKKTKATKNEDKNQE